MVLAVECLILTKGAMEMAKHRGNGTIKKRITLILAGLVLLGLLVPAVTNGFDNSLLVQPYTLYTEKVTVPLRLVVIADLHSCLYGGNQSLLYEAIKLQSPDVLLFCGDIYDDDLPEDNTLLLLDALNTQYPSYYVTGNHEFRRGQVGMIKDLFVEYGVTVLEGQCDTLQIGSQQINICGVDDFSIGHSAYTQQLAAASQEANDLYYTVLLAHRPEQIELYAGYGFDLVLSGHAHGGQWRIPGVLNGLLAPDQGLFPRYAGGAYTVKDTTLIVSRGLAKESTMVPRIYNRPELVVIDLLPTTV